MQRLSFLAVAVVTISLLRREMGIFSVSSTQQPSDNREAAAFVVFYLQGSRDKLQLFHRDAIAALEDTHR